MAWTVEKEQLAAIPLHRRLPSVEGRGRRVQFLPFQPKPQPMGLPSLTPFLETMKPGANNERVFRMAFASVYLH